MKLESLVQYLDGLLAVADHPDYRFALNGLQVGRGDEPVKRVCAAVDAGEAAISEAVERDADLLIVHHGLFWDGVRPVTGRRHRKLKLLLDGGVALYSVHLPLDSHVELGNSALLADALGVEARERFGMFEGVGIGWRGRIEPTSREALAGRIRDAVGGQGEVRVIPGGPEPVCEIGVLTGGGGSYVEEAAAAGLDALVTGEGSHHTYLAAMELGVSLFYAGHYATETFGVKALAEHAAERFGLEAAFLDHPTGM